MKRPVVPGVHEIFGLQPTNAVLRLRVLPGEVVVEIENGTTKTTSAAYLTPAEARRLADEFLDVRGASERRFFGRDADGVHIVGGMVVIRVDGKNRDRVVLESIPKIERFLKLLAMLADDVQPEMT